DKAWLFLFAAYKIQENFIGDDGHVMAGADFVQLPYLCRFSEVASGIVGMYNDDPSRAWGDRLLQRMKINVPAVVVKERIANELHVLNICKEIKQRITRRGDQELVAGIAQQAEDKGVSLAGAGGEDQVLDRDLGAAGLVILGDGRAGVLEPARIRMVLQRARLLQGL